MKMILISLVMISSLATAQNAPTVLMELRTPIQWKGYVKSFQVLSNGNIQSVIQIGKQEPKVKVLATLSEEKFIEFKMFSKLIPSEQDTLIEIKKGSSVADGVTTFCEIFDSKNQPYILQTEKTGGAISSRKSLNYTYGCGYLRDLSILESTLD